MSNGSKPHPDDASPGEQKRKDDEKLDEAIADSMIASDPPASVSKGKPTAPPQNRPHSAGEKGGRR